MIFLSIPSQFARIHSSTFHAVFIATFTEGLLQKVSMSIRPLLIGSTTVTSHAAVTNDARSIQIYSHNIRIRC